MTPLGPDHVDAAQYTKLQQVVKVRQAVVQLACAYGTGLHSLMHMHVEESVIQNA